MRTRLIRPEFWADSRMADFDEGTRLTYIGLWCLADDDGYLKWSQRDIAAELYRFESPAKRERRVARQLVAIVASKRVQVLDCGNHGLIPSLPDYRIKGGNLSRQHHEVHTKSCRVRTSTDKSPSVLGSVSVSVSVAAPDEMSPSDEEAKRAMHDRWARPSKTATAVIQ